MEELQNVKNELELYKKQYKIALSLLKEGYGNEYAEYKYRKDLDSVVDIPNWNEEFEEWIFNQANKELNEGNY